MTSADQHGARVAWLKLGANDVAGIVELVPYAIVPALAGVGGGGGALSDSAQVSPPLQTTTRAETWQRLPLRAFTVSHMPCAMAEFCCHEMKYSSHPAR